MKRKISGFAGITSRKLLLMCIDMASAGFTYIVADVLYSLTTMRPSLHLYQKAIFALILLASLLFSRLLLGIYSSVWRYANTYAFIRLLIADALAGVIFIHAVSYFRGIYFTGWTSLALICMITLVTLFSRFAYQLRHSNGNIREKVKDNIKYVAIIGAGQIGVMLAEELRLNQKSHYTPYCFVDIDKSKVGNNISGIRVLEADDGIIEKLKSLPIDEIIIALPKIEGDKKEKIFNFYKKTGLKIKIYDFAFDERNFSESKRIIRDIKIEDLLFREPVSVINGASASFYKNKRVLVTGGGGSIGSEICRQIAKCNPSQLIVIDIYENNVYDIQQELLRKHGKKLNLAVEIASVRDREELDCLFNKYKPQIIFHAAAHKHVPLMEGSPSAAVKNNIFGTYNTADMAEKHRAEKFILVSTDKAVNPTNIMGATKRFCEMIVQSRHDSYTSFAAVRFGNVLDSNGSVIPLFKKQIEEGGPITITDMNIVRYFMTIPEASQLVIQAGIMARRGELYVLDMGKPVKIIDLAENLIRLSGLVPREDIDIVEIGLRPGEKLYEEILIKDEGYTVTNNKKILIEKDVPCKREEIDLGIEILKTALLKSMSLTESDIIKETLKQLVASYADPEEVNGKAKNAPQMIMCFLEEGVQV